MTLTADVAPLERFFRSRGREAFDFQRQTWAAYIEGKSGLIQAPTGMGKTLAAALGPMIEPMQEIRSNKAPPLTLLWITPLRALANDTAETLGVAAEQLGLNWAIELRTSDTSASVRKRQKTRLPTALITTPESASLLLSYMNSADQFKSLRCVVVDEWHELMGTKRGVQTELVLARLRNFRPGVRIWGLSATLADVEESARALLGHQNVSDAAMIKAPDDKPIVLESILPATMERFPWAGHLGLKLLNDVIARLESAASTLIFTNTRSQSEIWFRALLEARPDWLGEIAIHHGSIDRKTRQQVEQMLRDGKLKVVVCTSSLDLGVDFWPVEQVMQIGSPKSIARAMQRAGRSGHRPGAISRLICVPTQAFELIEFSATRHAIEQRSIETRDPVVYALDVLAQHVVTIAAGGGFDENQLLQEIRTTNAFSRLSDQHWQWVLDFAHHGGQTLTAYPRFARIVRDDTGRWTVSSDSIARMHRMNIGTITSDGMMLVQLLRGKRLGMVEEAFIAKLKHGDTFSFAGRLLEFVRVFQMVAVVRLSRSKRGLVPRWMGGKLPMSQSLADAVRMRLDQASRAEHADEEMQHVRPILDVQARWSAIPRHHQLLIEQTKLREGYLHYLYPFQGKLVHEGLSALLVYRLQARGIKPITATFNDYGIELLSPLATNLLPEDYQRLLAVDHLADDLLACINTGELARRHFREIARIAGLLVTARPGGPKSARQLQASSELIYDVFREFDPENLLMAQARREVLERQLEYNRLQSALSRLGAQELLITNPHRISPLAFPLWAERIASQQLRMESRVDRIERLARQLEAAAEEDR